jgi:hypothetical protein
LGIASDLATALSRVRSVERQRLTAGPKAAVEVARWQGRRGRSRDASQRCDLRLVIKCVDRLWPGRPNCYRRVLLEVSMDGNAAHEPIYFGLNASGAPHSGHAWLSSGDATGPAAPSSYDAIIAL